MLIELLNIGMYIKVCIISIRTLWSLVNIGQKNRDLPIYKIFLLTYSWFFLLQIFPVWSDLHIPSERVEHVEPHLVALQRQNRFGEQNVQRPPVWFCKLIIFSYDKAWYKIT